MAEIIEIECPECHGTLWVDLDSKTVVQHKRAQKKNFTSFDELLVKEKQKKEKVEERFNQAKELGEAKKKKAEEFFKKSFDK